MEVTVNTLSEVSKEIEITANPVELQPHFEQAYKEYLPKIEIKGFRKGKAPLDLVKKLYGEMIEQDSLDKVASELFRQVVVEKDLKPIGEPSLVDMNYKRGERFRCKIQYDVRPTIELKQYKDLTVEAVIHTPDEQELEDEILRLRKMNSTTEEVERVTDEEHIVSATLQEVDPSGFPIIGKKTDDARFYLADPQLEQPFKDALKSAERGGEHRIQFEHQHGDHTHKVDVKAKITKVEKLVLPELNDDFVAKVTKDKMKTVAELKTSVEEDLETYWKEKNRRSKINAIVSEVIRLHEFQVPESLIRSVLEGLVEEIKNQYPDKKLPHDFDVEKFYQENRPYAIFQSKWALLREEIITAENMTASDDDLTTLAEREAPKIGIDKERLITYYKSSDQAKDRIVGDKLMDFLIGSSTIKELDDKTLPNTISKG
ncbi:MAG: trigger factor [Ignavibacteriales bacterium]|nr:trigger factor [Ignavibacteriales bacterium]